MNSSSRLSLPCSAGKVRGSPSSRILPRERNSTRSQTSSTSYMLCEVHSTPPSPCAANSRILHADFPRHGRIERGRGFVEQQQARIVEHRLSERDARLFAGGKHAALGIAESQQIELFEQGFDA